MSGKSGQSHELFSRYAQRWLDTRRVKGRPLAPKTLELYRVLLRLTSAPTFSSRQLSAITPEAVRRWHAEGVGDSSAMSAAKSYRLLRAISRPPWPMISSRPIRAGCEAPGWSVPSNARSLGQSWYSNWRTPSGSGCRT